jgi:hypothetical protein
MPVPGLLRVNCEAGNEMGEVAELYGDISYRTQEECFAFFERVKPTVEKSKKINSVYLVLYGSLVVSRCPISSTTYFLLIVLRVPPFTPFNLGFRLAPDY